ncbi:hypothetical protein [Streptomyces sp. NPDC059564]|uniref:hypothetical protein n=1 Tax=Streptomyces sp. NPDC059564 TaxID=3346865 RepID=UPI0036B0454E
MTTARQHRTHIAGRQLLAAATVTAAVVVLTAGCTKDLNDNRAAPPSPSANPSTSTSTSVSADPQAAEKSRVLATYSAFWDESVKAYQAGTEKGTKLVDYAAKDALNQTLTDIANMQRAGTAMKGTPGHRAEVSAVNMSGELPTATISDCFDLSTWKIIDRASGQVRPFPTEQPMRYITEFDAEFQGGRWMLTKFVRHGDRTC